MRPHLQEFLEEVGKDYEIVIFTASNENYANKVLDVVDRRGNPKLNSGRHISYRLFRHHCIVTSNS